MTGEGGSAGQGVIFRMNTDGSGFTLLHTFVAATGDGWSPLGSLTLVGNTLYGMTRQGGGGAGTIFEINTDGSNYNRLHTFTGQLGGDGTNPFGSLTLAGSTLFGTTPTGGATPSASFLALTWTEAVTPFCTRSPVDPMTSQPRRPDFRRFDVLRHDRTGGADNLGTVYSFTPIPEPSSFLLLTAAASVAAIARRCRRRKASRSPGVPGNEFSLPWNRIGGTFMLHFLTRLRRQSSPRPTPPIRRKRSKPVLRLEPLEDKVVPSIT